MMVSIMPCDGPGGSPSSHTAPFFFFWCVMLTLTCQCRQMENEREDDGWRKKKRREREATRRRLAHGVAAVCLCWQTHLSWWEGKRLAKEGRTKPVGCGYQAAVMWFHGYSTNGKRGVLTEAVEFYRLGKTKNKLLIDTHNRSTNFVFLMVTDHYVTVQQKHS